MQFGEESSLLDHAACARRLSTMISGLFSNAQELCEAMTKLKLEGYDLDCVINYMGDGYCGNPLFLAIDHLDATAVRHMFQFGGNIHLVDSTTNFSLMHFAARRGDIDMIELLIEMGVSMTDVQEELQTAVYVRNHTATTAILELSIDLLDLTYVGKVRTLHSSLVVGSVFADYCCSHRRGRNLFYTHLWVSCQMSTSSKFYCHTQDGIFINSTRYFLMKNFDQP